MKPCHNLTPDAPRRVLIVPDKFKGTLSASAACAAMAKGWQSARPRDQIECLSMSDGGDGFGEVMGHLLNARLRSIRTLDAAHRPITTHWWWEPAKKLAIVEAARVIGLARLPARKFHPFQLDTYGLGRVLDEARRLGARRCVIGIGGSATNDAGFGVARALGWQFQDAGGGELDQWWQLHRLVLVVPPVHTNKLPITVAVDVSNPLLGSRGCSRIYGPQKGLRPGDIVFAEKCLHRLTVVLKRQLNIDCAGLPGAGAAGGLGFGLMAFAGAKAASGFAVFAQAARLENRIKDSDVVITGEGALDRQTFMGKGVGRIAQLCKKLHVPCLALAGVVSAPAQDDKLFTATAALTDITTLANAKSRPAYYLERLARSVAL
jgi:glycerate kinase